MRFLTVLLVAAALSACSPAQIGVAHFPAPARGKAACIIKRESGGNPSAISPTKDYGLFQINRAAHKRQFERMYGAPFETKALSPSLNAKYARYLYDYYRSHGGTGWEPWAGGRYAC